MTESFWMGACACTLSLPPCMTARCTMGFVILLGLSHTIPGSFAPRAVMRSW
jgi:hypothetical protein